MKKLVCIVLLAATSLKLSAFGISWEKKFFNHSQGTWHITRVSGGDGNLSFEKNGTRQIDGTYKLVAGDFVKVTYTSSQGNSNGNLIIEDNNKNSIVCVYEGSEGLFFIRPKEEVKISNCSAYAGHIGFDVSKQVLINSPHSGDITIVANQFN